MLSTKLKEAAGNGADATLYVDDVFSTYLYTGTGATQTITNGIDLAGKGGMVWIKDRSDASYRHMIYDTARTTSVGMISSNLTDGDYGTTYGLNSFNSNGFQLTGASEVNQNASHTYASWTFREAAKFFDVQTITHTNGTANNIDLSVLGTVGMVIAKITTTTGDWIVWQRSLSAGLIIKLNTTATPTSSNAWISVSGTTATLAAAAPTGTYVIYAYAHDTSSTGIIQCGSFTTNAGGTGAVNLGWEPQYLMYKRTDTTENWQVFDTMRGFVSGPAVDTSDDALLIPNTSAAESTQSRGRPTATGFDAWTGFGTAPYIYMAIRRPNKPPTTGTQVFSPVLYTGNDGSSNPNAGFPVDFALIKSRNYSYNPFVFDRLRGANTGLITSATEPESTVYSTYLNSNAIFFDSNTNVRIGGPAEINGSPYNFVIENFKRASGFFDVVCYTGTGSATTQAHNLTVVPELMIVKRRDSLGGWFVYNIIGTATKYLTLGSQSGFTTSSVIWNNTEPTISVFSVGTNANVNASGGTYVAYLFATLAGISKVGSYTGNGTGQVIACGFSAGARFVLIKRTDSNGDWYTFDSARGLTVGSSPYLLLNSTAAETTGNNGVYASTGGFTLGSTASTTTNINGASYIYLSVA